MSRTHPWMKAVVVLLAAFLAVWFVACGGDDSGDGDANAGGGEETTAASGDPYIVASTQDLTGPVANFGTPVTEGFRTCVEEVNASGGVNGREIQFEVMDDAHNPDTVATNVRRLLDLEPIAFVAHIGSAGMIPTQDLIVKENIPMLAASPANDVVEDPNFFTVGFGHYESYVTALQYMEEELGGPGTAAFVGIETPASTDEIMRAKETAEAHGWEIPVTEALALDATDASSQAIGIRDAKPDVVITGLLSHQLPIVFGALQSAGLDVPMINMAPTADDEALETVNDPQLMVVREITSPSDPSSDRAAELAELAEEHGAEEHIGSTAFSKGFVLCELLKAALEDCGEDCTGQTVIDYLAELDGFEIGDIGQPLTYADGNRRGTREARIYRWDGSAPEVLSDYYYGLEYPEE